VVGDNDGVWVPTMQLRWRRRPYKKPEKKLRWGRDIPIGFCLEQKWEIQFPCVSEEGPRTLEEWRPVPHEPDDMKVLFMPVVAPLKE